MPNPTIVAASLDSSALETSINKLVETVNKKTDEMAKHLTDKVGEMENAIKKLGSINIDEGTSGGGTKKQIDNQKNLEEQTKKTTQSLKEQNLTLDQQATAQQKAARASSADFLSYIKSQNAEMQKWLNFPFPQYGGNAIINGIIKDFENQTPRLKEEIARVRAEIDKSMSMPFKGGDYGFLDRKRLTAELNEYELALSRTNTKEVANTTELNKQLQTIKEINSSKAAKAVYEKVSTMPTDNVDQAKEKLEALYALKEKVKNTPLLSKSAQNNLEVSIDNTKKKVEQLEFAARGTNQTESSIKSLNAAVEQNIQREQERKEAIRQTGLAARETANQLIKSAYEQASATGSSPITGIKELTVAVEQMRKAYFDMSATEKASPIGLALEDDIKRADKAITVIRKYNKSLLGVEQNDIHRITNTSTLESLRTSLKALTDQYNKLTVAELNAGKGDALIQHFQDTTRAAQILQRTLSRPISLKAALSGDERTLDDIAYKMQRLRAYKQGIDLTKPNASNEIKQVDEALSRLQKDADKWMSKSKSMIEQNNALGRSWNYMKNRLAFYFTVGASTAFIKNLIEVRSQYEMNERALGILINSAERGTQIFNELSQMALVSPYTLIELSTAAKQLTAYDVAAKDVVGTTRRLADMTAAVGIPIERLTYALGQIKAYGYLNNRDARMFSNAGIPLVKQLSEYYTELEGRMVSVGDVYDRIKKKAVDYNEVMSVIYKMTDEGGKFFGFQAKMADTLKVQLANLTLAWNNMLNDIGKSEQGVFVGGIKALKELFLRWKDIERVLFNIAIAFGVVKLGQIGYIVKNQKVSVSTAAADVASKKFVSTLYTMKGAFTSLISSPMTWWMLLATAAVSAGMAIYEASEKTEEFNKSVRKGAEENYKNITKFLEQYQTLRDSLYSANVKGAKYVYADNLRTYVNADENNKLIPKGQVTDINDSDAKKAWEEIREQIELTTAASDVYIEKLLAIKNVSERLRQAFNILDDIKTVNAALKETADDTFAVSQSYSGWWNLWTLPDGLKDNIKDYREEVDDTASSWEKLGKTIAAAFNPLALWTTGYNVFNNYVKDSEDRLADFRDDLKETTDSILNFIELKGWSGDEGKINQVFEQVTKKLIEDQQLNPQDAYLLQVGVEEARSKASKEALEKRIADEKAALAAAADEETKKYLRESIGQHEAEYVNWDKYNGRKKVEWERFTKWLKEQHISETTQMFKDMDAEDIKSLNFQEGKHAEWVDRMVTQYANEHKMSYDEAFGYLKSWVKNANQWSIFIPLIIGTGDQKSLYDTLNEADQRLKQVNTEIERLEKVGAGSVNYAKAQTDLEELYKERSELFQKDARDEQRGRKAAAAARKAQKQAESELQKALKEELQLIDKVRSSYKALTKEGATHFDAIEKSTQGFEKSVENINKVLGKFGIQPLDLTKYAGVSNPREIVNLLQIQLDKLTKTGAAKPSEIQDLQIKIKDLKLEADKYDLTMITKGLNNELDKLKDEYELAVELDANPELGDMFAQMFGIDTPKLPSTFGEALDKAQKVIDQKLKEMNINVPFNLMRGDINKFIESAGVSEESAVVKELISAQKTWQDMFKKNITDTEKVLDDYIKKYGDYSDKIAEIEANRLEQMKKLNEAYYTEEMRRMPEYLAKMRAIQQGADRQKQSAAFEEFKNSRYYTMMFENLDYISTKTISDMRDKLLELRDSMNELTPEQLKWVTQQYEKLEQKLIKRSPFKTLTKDVKEYFRTLKERKAAIEEFRDAQKQYNKQLQIVAALKERREQLKRNENVSKLVIISSETELGIQEEILAKLKEQLDAAQEKVDKYNLIKKLALEEAQAVANMVSSNLKGISELRDNLRETFGLELSNELDAVIDDLSKVGDGIGKVTSSAQSGDVFGIASGAVDIFTGIGDAIASIFGDGSARTKRINKEIERSVEVVRQLNMAYKGLERTVAKTSGAEETAARRSEIANKKAQLAELERQMELEKSKRSKDRDDEKIKQYEETIQDLRYEIDDLADDVVNNLLGTDAKNAAEAFVDAWVDAWRAGETTLDAIAGKMDEMIFNLIKKAATAKIVQNILKPLYEAVDKYTSEDSEGGVDLTTNELKALAALAASLGVDINEALTVFYGNLESLGGITREIDNGSKNLSALQQGIQSITEATAGALEAYWNANTQQQYVQSGLLTEIRDTIAGFDLNVQLGVMTQILLQMQASYQVQMSIQNILSGALNPSGRAFSVELIS